MANELAHKTVGTSLTQAEFEDIGLHVFDSQATGDMPYASSATQLTRLAKGAANTILVMGASIPAWSATLAGLTLTSPTLTTPALGTPSAGVLTSCTGLPMTTGVTGTLAVANGGTGVTASTGTVAVVRSTSPTLVTPVLGVATATSINKITLTQPATGATLTLVEGSSLITAGAYAVTLTATGATGVTLPTTGTLATLAGSEVFTNKTLTAPTLNGTTTLGSTPIFDVGAGTLEIDTTIAGVGFLLKNTNDGVSGTTMRLETVSASPANEDAVGTYTFYGRDSGAGVQQYGLFECLIENVTAGSEAGKFVWVTGVGAGWNTAMTLSSAGVLAVDLGGSGAAAQVDLFDEYDDALMLRQGIQQNNRELLADMGVLERKDTGSGYMMRLQPMVRLLAGGIYQSRAMIDGLQDRLALIERKLLVGG